MPAKVAITLAGEPVELHAGRALYWLRRQRLLIADLHLGKADVFRRAGIGLPRGGTSHDLERLTQLIDATGAVQLWILGDVLHGPSNDTAWQDSWRIWRARHGGVRVAALIGNHDRALTRAGLGIELMGEAVDDAPFALRHHPHAHPSLHVLCGHVHPRVSLPGLRGARLPAFWLQPGITVLPAFSEFTGGVLVAPAAGEQLAICAGKSIVWVNA